jgi:hypothetical protein
VKGRTHLVADRLSRRPWTVLDDADKAEEVDINDFITTELNCVQIILIGDNRKATLLEQESS